MTTQNTAADASVAPEASAAPIHSERVFVTAQLAREWLKLNTRNRSVSRRMVTKLIEALQGGQFRETTDAVGFYALDGALQNGQQRLTAIAETGIGAYLDVKRGMPEDSIEAQDQGRSRSAADIFELKGHRKDLAYVAAYRYTLILLWVWTGRMSSFNDPDRKPTVQDMLTFAEDNWLDQSFEVGKRAARSEAKISAALSTAIHWLATEHFGTDIATRFFDIVATGIGLTNEQDPIYRLRQQLLANRKASRKMTAVVLAAVIIKALNSYAREEPLEQLSYRHGGDRPEPFPRFGQPRRIKRKVTAG